MTEPELAVSEPELIVNIADIRSEKGEWLPDDRLMWIQRPPRITNSTILVIQNWFEELKRKLAEAQ